LQLVLRTYLERSKCSRCRSFMMASRVCSSQQFPTLRCASEGNNLQIAERSLSMIDESTKCHRQSSWLMNSRRFEERSGVSPVIRRTLRPCMQTGEPSRLAAAVTDGSIVMGSDRSNSFRLGILLMSTRRDAVWNPQPGGKRRRRWQ